MTKSVRKVNPGWEGASQNREMVEGKRQTDDVTADRIVLHDSSLSQFLLS